MQPSLLLIVAYLGRLPQVFDLWLESCRRNPHVNWLVTNDHPPAHDFPPNVQFLQQSADQIKARMQAKVGVVPEPFHPYKLCDYKITYGVMFEEELQGYDYWGVCDLDMIFGDIGKHLDLNALSQYTKIFWHGHLTIYRNTSDVNNAFRLPGPGWDALEVLRTPYFRSLDEKAGIYAIWRLHGLPVYHANLIADVLPAKLRMYARKQPNVEEQVFAWVEGRVVCYQRLEKEVAEREYMYIHFQKRWLPRGDVEVGDPYFITPNGMVRATTLPPSAADVRRLSTPSRQAYVEFWKRRLKEQVARVRRHYAGEKILRQPPADVLPLDDT